MPTKNRKLNKAVIEIEKNLNDMEFKDFYRWLVINIVRLKYDFLDDTNQRKRGGELTNLHIHPRHSSSKY
jgi:hypothetical protein